MGFLKKFKEQKQDGPDAPAEPGPVSQPSIGPEDFLPPEPVPRTTRSRAKATSAVPTTPVDLPSPRAGKGAARGKAKEQQQPPEQPKAPTSPATSPKGGKGKAAANQAAGKAAAGTKSAQGSKSGKGSARETAAPTAAARSSVAQGPASAQTALKRDADDVKPVADPPLEPVKPVQDSVRTPEAAAQQQQGTVAQAELPVADTATLAQRGSELAAAAAAPLASPASVLSDADMPRDPRKRHRAIEVEPLALQSPGAGVQAAVVTPQTAAAVVAVPTPDDAQFAASGLGPKGTAASGSLHNHPQEPTAAVATGEAAAAATAAPRSEAAAASAEEAASGAAPPALDVPAAETGALPPPPPMQLPPPPPLPPHLAGPRVQSQPEAQAATAATGSGAQPGASRDESRSAYVMTGLRETTSSTAPSGGDESADRNRDRDRDRHRHEAERDRDRSDRDRGRDRSERDKDRQRQPDAGVSKRSGGSTAAATVTAPGRSSGRPSSPSRRDRDRDGGREDGKVSGRSRSPERSVKASGDKDSGSQGKDRQRDKDDARSDKDKQREKEKEREKEREREKAREREREKEREREREKERERAKEREREREREKDKQREREKERARDRENSIKEKDRSNAAAKGADATAASPSAGNAPRGSGGDRGGGSRDKAGSSREPRSGRSRSRSRDRDTKRSQTEDVKSPTAAKEPSSAAANAGAAAAAPGGSSQAVRKADVSGAPSPDNDANGIKRRGDANGGGEEPKSENIDASGHNDDVAVPAVALNIATAARQDSAPAEGTATTSPAADTPTAGSGGRSRREPIVWNPLALPAFHSHSEPKNAASKEAEAEGTARAAAADAAPELDGQRPAGEEQALQQEAGAPLSPSPRRTYSTSDSEPTRSRSRGYSSSEEGDEAGSVGRADAPAAEGAGEGVFDNNEEEPLDEYDFNDLMDADLMDEHLDEHVRQQDDPPVAGDAAAAPAVAQPAVADNAADAKEQGGGSGGKDAAKEQGSRARPLTSTGRVAYEDMGAPGPNLSRPEQVDHVTAGLVGQVGADMLAKLRKLLLDMPALDLSTVRPWALRSLLAISDDDARWRASQALLSIEWSTANNPGGVLHSRLQRAVEMERMQLFRNARVARAKRGRSPSPGGAAPAPKRSDWPSDAKAEHMGPADARRRRSRSRDRAGRSRGSSKERGHSREPRDGSGRVKSRDAEEERRKERERAGGSSKDRDREREARDRDMMRPPLREPDVKSRKWEDVVRATSRGCIAKLPRAFIEDARRVLYDVDLDCSQIDASAWDPLPLLPNCEQRLNALRALRNIRWKERFNVSATVKGTLLRCAEQVQRDMQRRELLRPGMPMMPMAPVPGMMASAAGVGVGAMAARRDARYGPGMGAPPGPPAPPGSRLGMLPPPPPLPGAAPLGGVGMGRFPPPPDPRLTAAAARLRDRDRDRDRDREREDRSRQRSSGVGASAAAPSARGRSRSRSPSRGRRAAATRRSRSKSRSPSKGRVKARSKTKSRSRSPERAARDPSPSKPRSRSHSRGSGSGRSSSRSKSRSKSRSPERRGIKRSRSPAHAEAEDEGGAEDGGATAATAGSGGGSGGGGSSSRPLSSEFKERMYNYLKGFGKLDLSGVDEKVFECLGRLSDDSARMDCLRRLSGVQWHAVSGAQETQKRLRALLERGTNELLKGHNAPAKKGFAGGSKRRAGAGAGSGRR